MDITMTHTPAHYAAKQNGSNMSNSGLTPYQDELLVILQEECGEAVQEICKIFRFGIDEESHHVRGSSHLACLTAELGDILCMIELLYEADIGITEEGLREATLKKRDKVTKWMTHKVDDDAVTSALKEMQALAKANLNNYKAKLKGNNK
jgi:hypothetical protein